MSVEITYHTIPWSSLTGKEFNPLENELNIEIKKILTDTNRYYTEKIKTHGPTSLGVDWKTQDSQEIRFDQLLKICDSTTRFSLCDYGCGYGHLLPYMKSKKISFQYLGIDISPEMIQVARQIQNKSAHFQIGSKPSHNSDYGIASGIFNVKQDVTNKVWKNYFLKTLGTINRFSTKGFSFNCLTKYSDKDRMKKNLYYGDPVFFFDYCKKMFSKNVALLHDYGLYEFTILVRKQF
jgi:SAM-dependent methyltransferase